MLFHLSTKWRNKIPRISCACNNYDVVVVVCLHCFAMFFFSVMHLHTNVSEVLEIRYQFIRLQRVLCAHTQDAQRLNHGSLWSQK